MNRYVIYCDESDRKGDKYSYFLAGVIVKDCDIVYVEKMLIESKKGYPGEMKWNGIKDSRWKVDIYKSFIDTTFRLIEEGYIKFRLSFVPTFYTTDYNDIEISFFKLYYLFVINSFKYWEISNINFDRLPYQTHTKVREFKAFISNGLNITNSQISEIDSSKHIILQCADVILGGVCAKLNEKFKNNSERKYKKRPKTTVVKEDMYKYIYNHITKLTPSENYQRFNIGVTTKRSYEREVSDKYRHYQYQRRQPQLP
jgi:hypothetical protein